jgi:hypothetical protein
MTSPTSWNFRQAVSQVPGATSLSAPLTELIGVNVACPPGSAPAQPVGSPVGARPTYRAIAIKIGEELLDRFEPPQEMPYKLLTVIRQLDELGQTVERSPRQEQP